MTNQEAIKILKSKMDGSVDTSYEWCDCILTAVKALEERPTGKWTHEYDENGLPTFKHKWRCSVCNEANAYGKPKYCMHCGARMEVSE